MIAAVDVDAVAVGDVAASSDAAGGASWNAVVAVVTVGVAAGQLGVLVAAVGAADAQQ